MSEPREQLPARPEDLPKGTELERAALGLLHDVAVTAWAARDRAGVAGFTRAFQAGLCDAFDVLAFDAGSVEAARDAVGWALGRMNAIMAAIGLERTPPPERP